MKSKKISAAVTTVVASAAFTLISKLLSSNVQFQFIVGLSTLIIGTLITLRFFIDDSFEKTKTDLSNLIISCSSLPQLSQLPTFEMSLHRILTSLTAIEKRSNPFFFEHAKDLLGSMESNLADINRGYYECDDREELFITQKLLKHCSSTLKAVSYGDEPWWNSAFGSAYLALHRKLSKKVAMIRIFILEDGEDRKLKSIIEQHKKIKIETYVLDSKKDVPQRFRSDFVIYDDKVLRQAFSTPDLIGKRAIVTDDHHSVRGAINKFDALLQMAKTKTKSKRQ